MGRPKDCIKPIAGYFKRNLPAKPKLPERFTLPFDLIFDFEGRAIYNCEQKFNLIMRDPVIKKLKLNLQNKDDILLLKSYMTEPPLHIVEANPEVFYSNVINSGKADAIAKKFFSIKPRPMNEFLDLIYDPNVGIEDCNYIIKQLAGKKGEDARYILRLAEVKADYLAAEKKIKEKVNGAIKSYYLPINFVK